MANQVLLGMQRDSLRSGGSGLTTGCHRRTRSTERARGSGSGSGAAAAAAALAELEQQQVLCSTLAWEVAAPALPAVADDFRLVAEQVLPVSTQEAMQLLLADSSGFLAATLKASGSTPVSMSRWQPSSQPGVTGERVFKFEYISSGPLGKIKSNCTQTQRYSVYADGSASFSFEQRMPDLPAGVGKAFHVAARWDLVPGGGSGGGAAGELWRDGMVVAAPRARCAFGCPAAAALLCLTTAAATPPSCLPLTTSAPHAPPCSSVTSSSSSHLCAL